MTAASEKDESAPLRLAKYLKEFVGLRSTTIRDVAKYDAVLWFGDMPQEPDCRSGAWADGTSEDDPWLEVRKQEFKSPPSPPESILEWIDQKAFRQATPEMPALLRSILVEDPDADLMEGESPPVREVFLSDHPGVVAAYEAFRPRWETWSADQRRRESIQNVYAELFRLHTQVQKQGEIVEVVLGLGLIDWRAKSAVRRHAFVAQVELNFDPKSGVIRVEAPGEGARLRIEDDMLEAEQRPDRSHYGVVDAQLEQVDDAIWDKSLMHAALKTWSGALSADSTWLDGLDAKQSTGSAPTVSFAPALILRRRLQTGMVRIYEKMIENLSGEAAEIPAGWGGLTDDDWGSDSEAHPHPNHSEVGGTHFAKAPSETYFPLPANREQRRIVEALDHHQGVLVQGPPGTGKSHSIANLMCHLLATGKRVLITAETGRALQVLKDKLPEEIKPLCVSLLGQGGDAFAELNSAVQGITARYSAYSPGAYDAQIGEIDRELDRARSRLASIETEIRSLREGETVKHNLLDGAYLGTASAIAARVAEERERFSWIELAGDTSSHPKISNSEAARWLEIRRRYSNDDVEASNRRIPGSDALPDPADFSAIVSNAAAATARNEQVADLRAHWSFPALRALPADRRIDLEEDLRNIEDLRLALQRVQAEWLPVALREAVAGQDARWKALFELSTERVGVAETLLSRVGDIMVTGPEGLEPRALRADAQAAIEHLEGGGKWKRFGITTPQALKGRTYLRRDVLIDGRPASDAERLGLLRDYLDLQLTLVDLVNAWKDVGATDFPSDRRLCVASFRGHAKALGQVLEYADACDLAARTMSRESPPIPIPNWLVGETRQWVDVISAVGTDEEMSEAVRQVDACGNALIGLSRLHDAHPVVRALVGAIESRDATAFSEGHARVVQIEQTRDAQAERSRIERVLRESTPRLVQQIEDSLEDPAWDARLSAFEEAWRWAVADSWLEKRSNSDYKQELWRSRHDAETDVGRLISETAALRAWRHFFNRLSKREASALRGWREAVKSMGKGTGKSARLARLRREARHYMDECRDAIPIWIMPRYLVAEMIDPGPGRYDLVIVDEASQLGIESLFLFYISKKIIVVGDDQQISPAGIGIPDEAVAGLQHRYLDGYPHPTGLSPQSSLYQNAKIRFNQNIVLREHFRCMPEIIQFSNDLCYAVNGTPLDPLRAYPANRLQPLVLRHVHTGYRQGSPQNAQNPPEAEAIVAQICACIDDPRYARATLGVISLQGEAQAKLIEGMLLKKIDSSVIEERKLICGDASAFQGDERTVIFLSMVAAAGDHRIGVLSNEAARQRFNVAVSRAQDQLWLFHSAELDMLSPHCMRHRLLSYMLDPQRQRTEEEQQKFDSNFERHVYQRITDRGFHVRTQVCVGDPTNHRYRIDLVVEGMQGRLAVECDGDEWHGADRYELDMARQRDLERAGWQFARIRGGDFYRDPIKAMEPVWGELDRLGIQPGGIDVSAAAPPTPRSLDPEDDEAGSVGVEPTSEPLATVADRLQAGEPSPPRAPIPIEVRIAAIDPIPTPPAIESRNEEWGGSDTARPLVVGHSGRAHRSSSTPAPYVAFEGRAGPDPRHSNLSAVAEGLHRVLEVEGPMVAKRAYDTYLRGCGVLRMGGELKKSLNKALQQAIRNGRVVKEDELGSGGLVYSVVRVTGSPAVVLRMRGPRDFEEVPPSELQLVARLLARDEGFESGSDAHLRAVLEFFDLKRLTVQVGTRLLDILSRRYPYVEDVLNSDGSR